MFEKNLRALSIKNPLLANKLRGMNVQNIEAFATKSGDINICFNNVNLHNDINPIEEARQIFEPKIQDNLVSTFHVIYGLGIGYLFKRAYISVTGKIIVFEPFLDVLRFTLEYVDFSKELEDKRVFICTTPEEVIAIINNKFIVGDKLELTYLPSYISLEPTYFNDLTNKTLELLKIKKQDQNTLLSRAANWGITTLNHLKQIINAIPVDVLSGYFDDVPVIIVSAGPTFKENIELLKQNRDKYLLITVNSALKTLLNNDIKPDFCVISENFMIDKQFEDLQNLDDIYFILHSRAQNYCWNLNKDNFVYLTETDGFANWYNKLLNNKYTLWPSAGSVSLLAFYIAFKILKSKNIILVGQDLAFINDEMYSSKVFKQGIDSKIQDNKLIVKHKVDENIQNEYSIELVQIKNSYGEEITTRIDYYNFIKQFEDIIKNEVSSEISVVNTSLKGAYIKGMQYKSLFELVESINTPEKSYLQVINNIVEKNKPEIEVNKKILLPQIKVFYEELDQIIQLSQKLIDIIDLFNKKYSKSPIDKDLSRLIGDFYQQKKSITDFIAREEVIFFIMQKDYLDYANKFIMPSEGKPLTIIDYKKNLDNERIFLTNLEAFLDIIKKYRNI